MVHLVIKVMSILFIDIIEEKKRLIFKNNM
jgi:hypothetical protein